MNLKQNEFIKSRLSFVVADGEGGGASGKIGVGELQTRQQTEAVSPDFIVNDVDRIITKVRPQSNPLVMIATRVASSKSSTQVFEYYELDTLPDSTSVKENTTEGKSVKLKTEKNDIFSPKETLIFPEIKGYEEDGATETPNVPLCAYVIKVDSEELTVKPINGKGKGEEMKLPVLNAGTKVLRAGRAHNEVDVQTAPYALFPKKKDQYIQKFKCQVEETTAMHVANKEADFTLSDQEEEAIFDMTQGMSKSLLLGAKRKIFDEEKKEVFFTGGIWGQIGKDFVYDNKLTKEDFINIFKMAFVGSNGSKRKTMFCGSDFLANLSLLELGNEVSVNTVNRFDLSFSSMKTNFGTLDVIYDENMDSIGMSKNAMIIDEDFVKRKDYVGITDTQKLSLRESGVRDTDGKVITRAFALYLQNPNTHIRITPKS